MEKAWILVSAQNEVRSMNKNNSVILENIYICIYICVCIYIYIYIERERERERERVMSSVLIEI